MDILLTHGYFLAADPREQAIMRPYPPLGILYLSAYLKARGVEVTVFDGTFARPSDLREVLARERPPVVGIYANMMTRGEVVAAARFAKAAGSIVVVGGPEPASYPAEYLARGADVVVEGEGEVTLHELVSHLAELGLRDLDRVDGILYRGDDGEVRRTAPRSLIRNLDALPLPDREAIDIDAYVDVWRRHHGQGAVSLITARGCPFTCNWCSHSVYGHTHRRRSPSAVIEEVRHLRDRYRPDLLWFADDVFTISKRWIQEYRDLAVAEGLVIPFETISREDRLDEETVRALADLGCWRLWIGSESGSQRVLDAMDRRTDAARVREMVHLLRRHGIQTGMFIMLGYEGEEVRDLEETVTHLKAAAPDTFLTTLAYPIKGTPYHERVADRVIAAGDWESSSDRELTVAGRRSRRFYDHANRWMTSEVTHHQLRARPAPRRVPRLVKSYVSARVGRVGMWLTRNQLEAPDHG
jgi:radical SAM superfamily enzyme YgiQ (UPF0313 family)